MSSWQLWMQSFETWDINSTSFSVWQTRVRSGLTEQDVTLIAALFAMLITVSLLMKAFVLRLVDGFLEYIKANDSSNNGSGVSSFPVNGENTYQNDEKKAKINSVKDMRGLNGVKGPINGNAAHPPEERDSKSVPRDGLVPMSDAHVSYREANGDTSDEESMNFYAPSNDETSRDQDFPTLAGGIAMLDAAGAPPPPRQLLDECFNLLSSSLLCNPHSFSQASSQSPLELQFSTTSIDEIKGCVLDLFDAPRTEYDVIFTSGNTQAMQLISDCLPWQECMRNFIYCRDAHTSMLGIREAAGKSGKTSVYVAMERQMDPLNSSSVKVEKHGGGEEKLSNNLYHNSQLWDVKQIYSGKHDASERTHMLRSEKPHRLGGQRFTLIGVTTECNFSGRRRTDKQINLMSGKNSRLLTK